MAINTTPTHWDCECKENYIHLASVDRCRWCGAVRWEQPDSRIVEICNELGITSVADNQDLDQILVEVRRLKDKEWR